MIGLTHSERYCKRKRVAQQKEQVTGFICASGNLKIAPRFPSIACTSICPKTDQAVFTI